jgi:hypothetical protein
MKRAWQNFTTKMDHYKASSIGIRLRILSSTVKVDTNNEVNTIEN